MAGITAVFDGKGFGFKQFSSVSLENQLVVINLVQQGFPLWFRQVSLHKCWSTYALYVILSQVFPCRQRAHALQRGVQHPQAIPCRRVQGRTVKFCDVRYLSRIKPNIYNFRRTSTFTARTRVCTSTSTRRCCPRSTGALRDPSRTPTARKPYR